MKIIFIFFNFRLYGKEESEENEVEKEVGVEKKETIVLTSKAPLQ